MTETKKTPMLTWINIAVGLALMLLFPMLPPIGTITPVGMKIMGIFLGMVFMWSAVDLIWPSILGLVLIALSGYTGEVTGYAAVKLVMKEAFGNDTILGLTFAMMLFGGVQYVGCTQYFIRFLMTRKFINRKPYVIMFMIFFASYLLAGLTNVIASLLILWPVSVDLMNRLGYKKGDKTYSSIIIGIMLAAAFGQPMFPFKGASMTIVSAYEKISGYSVNVLHYVVLTIVMSIILLLAYMAWLRFVVRPDVEALRNVTTEDFDREKLPPMNLKQKAFMIVIALYIILMLAPSFLPKSWAFVKLINSIGTVGLNMICVVVLMLMREDGKPVMDFKGIAAKSFNWNTYFLVASAMYGATALTNDVTGVKPFLVSLLQPILGGRPDFIFVLLILGFALITTNFANNAGMGVALMPIIIAFADQYPGVPAPALAMTTTLMVFVAIMTPAASPWCGMLYSRNDVTSKEIMQIGLPMCVIALLAYTFIGFPIAKIFFG